MYYYFFLITEDTGDELPNKLYENFDDDATSTILASLISQKSARDKTPTAMNSSIASILDDSTPSDSGVQLLDSVSSEMNESFLSNSGLDFDISNNAVISQSMIDSGMSISNSAKQTPTSETNIPRYVVEINGSALPDVLMTTSENIVPDEIEVDEIAMTKSDIDNSNVDVDFLTTSTMEIPDDMKTSICSTFDTEAIVFRRKVKKNRTNSTGTSGSVKKRVSFHEDILKNTRTDNIHIEHGFITYKGYTKKMPQRFVRNSWCSTQNRDDDYDAGIDGTCYRNACSDVLDYGKSDLYEQNDSDLIQFDNSGVFEYVPKSPSPPPLSPQQPAQIQRSASDNDRKLYHCKCSSSDSSESDDGTNGNETENTKRNDYTRKKSSSCDCIGQTNTKNNHNSQATITDNCYFSEPCIETMDESPESSSPKSVWRKEIKPKSSCLKKNYRETGVIIEHDLNSKVKTFNVHHQLPDMNNLIGSLKNIFSMPLPERGVPEGCEDLNNVYECLPDNDTPMQKPIELVITSQQGVQIRRKPELSLFPIPPADDEHTHVSIAADTSIGTNSLSDNSNSFRNKFIINCESTVIEHTGVFCENRDPEAIPDIPNSSSNCVTPQKPSKSILSFSATPLKQKIGNFFSSFSSSRSEMAQVADSPSPLRERERIQQQQLQAKLKKLQEEQLLKSWSHNDNKNDKYTYPNENDSLGTSSMTSSMISYSSDKHSITTNSTITSSTNTTSGYDRNDLLYLKPPIGTTKTSTQTSPNKKTRHLESPLRRRSNTTKFDRSKLSPDLFGGQRPAPNPMALITAEFDDLLTITTTSNDIEINESEIEIVDHSTVNEAIMQAQKEESAASTSNNLLRLPSSKSSLINRFLRNVTQKKINDATVKKNNILSAKYREPPKLFNNLYVKPAKPINFDSVADLNAEIAMEIEMNVQSENETEMIDANDFGIGVGEISADLFEINNLHFLRDDKEKVIKVCNFYLQRYFVCF